MNKLLIFIILSVVTLKSKADIFIFRGDTSYFHEKSPLEQYPEIDEIRKHLNRFESQPCFDCDPRGYLAEWTVINDALYLTGLYSEPGSEANSKADLNALFGVRTGRVKADWVNENLWLINKHSHPMAVPDIMTVIYKTETALSIWNGKVTAVKIYNYTDAKESVYMHNQKAREEFIYKNVNWNKIPDLKGQLIRVSIAFETGTSGKPENIRLLSRKADALYNDEALRVISLMPWSVYYKHGEVYKVYWSVPVVFNEENRRRYAR